ncbi:MAG: hypothetical protein K8R92_02530 [Planctomycetes bacterium]|nr:hypothetical protein [Planctomycetota bacterium]
MNRHAALQAMAFATLMTARCAPSQPSPQAKKQAPTAPTATNASGVAPPKADTASVIASNGFAYSPDELAPGYPEVVTIRLGNRLRIYSISPDWNPATLALLDKQKDVLWSIRLDLPPRGTVNGSIPNGIDPDSVRITRSAGAFDASHVSHLIGATEPEWSTVRMKELGVADEWKSGEPAPDRFWLTERVRLFLDEQLASMHQPAGSTD